MRSGKALCRPIAGSRTDLIGSKKGKLKVERFGYYFNHSKTHLPEAAKGPNTRIDEEYKGFLYNFALLKMGGVRITCFQYST
jgi:hypothetical protein